MYNQTECSFCFEKYFKTVILNIKELYIRCSDNIDKLDFLCCYKKMLEKIYNKKMWEKIYNKKKNKRVIFIIKRITRVKFRVIKKMNKK